MRAIYLGFSRNAGISKKTNKPYDICRLYGALPLQPGAETEGTQGTEWAMEPMLIPKLRGLNPGAEIELEMHTVMRFDKQEQQIASISIVANQARAVQAKTA